MYTNKTLKIFRNPKNIGEMKNPDGIGKVGNPICGDIMLVHLKVGKNKKNQEIIKDIKIKTFGCVAAIATSSIMSALVKGKTLDYAKKLKKETIAKELGGLPPQKMHCSNLASDALLLAIEDYERKILVKNKKQKKTKK